MGEAKRRQANAPKPSAKGKTPTSDECARIIFLFNTGRHAELENQTRLLVEQYPYSGFAWKARGLSLQLQGKDALQALQKATELLPDDAEAYNNLGSALNDLGQLDGAVASFRRALEIKPDYAMAHNNLGCALQDLGQLDGAVASYRRALEIKPDFAGAYNNLGDVLTSLGQFNDAAASCRRALEIEPDYAEALNNLGNVLKELGQLDGAVTSYRRALEIKPDFAEALNNLGAALIELHQPDDAVASCRRALEIKPDFAEALNNLGNVLKELGQLDGAVASYRRALEIEPDYAEALNNLGNVLKELGQLDGAVTSYRRALEIKPNFADAHNNLGAILADLHQLDGAIASYRRALEIKPGFAEAYNNLGITLLNLGQLDAAVANFRHALKIRPGFAEAHSGLGDALIHLGQLDGAVASYRRALEIKPGFAEAQCNLGNALRCIGQLDEAVASYRRALGIKPDLSEAYSGLLFLYGYHALTDSLEYLAQARNWERACVPAQDRQAARNRIFQRSPLTGRRLKVGYVSGDYRLHAVSYFIEQLFTHHDRVRIDLFAYSTHAQQDAITERLQSLVEHWVPLEGVPDAAIRDRIDVDKIDVLIDLSGHTAHNHLGVFARRAAPVQAHYLGYFASTGLTEMDYWIGDETLTPAATNSHFSEQVWRLPRVWVSYDGKADTPIPDWRPSRDGTVWLGGFNNLGKLTPATLALWAKVLHALPEGKLLLKTKELSDAGNRLRLLDAMSEHGILSDRIELHDSSATPDWPAHMAYYDRLDIALDPAGGVGGGTTTCDALWMGVPVITLEGSRMASRMTASMLNAIDCPEWIARSEAEYIDKVVALARDVEQRKVLRSIQRDRMACSPLCDARGLARFLENAYFEMFERWANDKFNDNN